MDSRKGLKMSSIVVLIFAVVSVLNIVSELLFGDLNNAEIPAGSPDNILLITKIILLAVSFVLLLPQIYIGLKGLKLAKYPDSSRLHIVIGIILLVLTAVDLISPMISVIKMESVFQNVSELCGVIVEVMVYYEYVKYARAVSQGR